MLLVVVFEGFWNGSNHQPGIKQYKYWCTDWLTTHQGGTRNCNKEKGCPRPSERNSSSANAKMLSSSGWLCTIMINGSIRSPSAGYGLAFVCGKATVRCEDESSCYVVCFEELCLGLESNCLCRGSQLVISSTLQYVAPSKIFRNIPSESFTVLLDFLVEYLPKLLPDS